MKIQDRLVIIETKLKYLEKLMYGLGGLILASLGINSLNITALGLG